MTTPILSQQYLKECLAYFPETGDFIWLKRPRRHFKTDTIWKQWNGRFALEDAGSITYSPRCPTRRAIRLDGERYIAARIAWFYVTGEWPTMEVDHINHDTADDRFVNLRHVSSAENAVNKGLLPSNKSGIHGVLWRADYSAWEVRISRQGIAHHVGSFKDFFEACCARKSIANRLGCHPNHGRTLDISTPQSTTANEGASE